MEEIKEQDLRKQLESIVDTILITGYCHADWCWTQSRKWHAERYALVFNEVLDIMKREDKYKWYFDTWNEELQPFAERYPRRVSELKERVKEGRIGIAGGTITNPQITNIGGELFIRNMKYGREFFEKEFPNVDLSVLIFNDVNVGYSQLPQLIRKGGYKYFRFTRPEALNSKGVPKDFFWEGLDGTRILCSRGDYGMTFLTNWIKWFPYDYKENWSNAFKIAAEEFLKEAAHLKSGILWVHEGMDDKRPLKGPRPFIAEPYLTKIKKIEGVQYDVPIDVIGFVEEWNKHEKIPMKFATPAEYFIMLERRKESLPVWKGILDPVCWSMMHGCKGYCPGNHQIEISLLTAEKICSIAHMLGEVFPENELREMWLDLLSISGHAIKYSYADGFKEVSDKGKRIIDRSLSLAKSKMKRISRRVKPSRDCFARIIVFNDLSWKRKDIVKVYLAFPEAGTYGLKITDTVGKQVPYQIVKWVPYGDGSISEADIIFIAEVPSLGYKTYYVSKSREEGAEAPETKEAPSQLETPLYKIMLKNGGIESIFFKPANIELLTAKGVLCNDILFYYANSMTDFRPGILNGRVDKVKCTGVFLLENGPVRKKILVKGIIGDCIMINREISIYDEIPRIDFSTRIHAPVGDGTFRAQFPMTFKGKIKVGIPFGAEDRDVSKEPYIGVERYYPGFENVFYAVGWLDYTSLDEKYGASIIPHVKDRSSWGFSFDQKKNIVELTLLQIMTLPKTGWLSEMNTAIEGHEPDEFAYSLYLHSGNWQDARVYRRSFECQNPLRPIVITGENVSPELPDSQSLLSIEPSNVVLSSLYYENEKLILRLYEQCGIPCLAELTLPFRVGSAIETDFNGKPIDENRHDIHINANKVTLQIKPWKIVNLEICEKKL